MLPNYFFSARPMPMAKTGRASPYQFFNDRSHLRDVFNNYYAGIQQSLDLALGSA
jgi:hypothetical protein